MDIVQKNKILRDEALKRVKRSDILHSSGLVDTNITAAGGNMMTYKERQEMQRKYVGGYDKSRLIQNRSGLPRARAVEGGTGRFDAQIRRVVKKDKMR